MPSSSPPSPGATANVVRRLLRRGIERVWTCPPGAATELALWRERILAAILAGGVALSPLAMVPAVVMLARRGQYAMPLVNIAAVATAVALLGLRRIPFSIRAGITLLIAYGIGLGVVLSVGPVSGGPAWLFCSAVLAGILFGVTGALVALGGNAATVSVLGWLWLSGTVGAGPLFQSPLQAFVAGVNFLFLNAICALSVAVLVRGLETAANRDKAVSQSLQGEIAARQRIARELEESETRLRIIFEHAAVGIAETTFDGRLTRVNRRFSDLLGYGEPAEIEGRQVTEVAHPDELPVEFEQIRKLLESQTDVHHVEMRMRRKDGAWIWTRVMVSLARDPLGRPSHFIGVMDDVTERRQALEALEKSEQRFRQLAEMMPETLFETDPGGRLTFANRKAMETFGYGAEDMAVGLQALDMIAPDERHRAMENMLRIGTGPESLLNEYTAVRKDGTRFPVMIRSAPIYHGGQLLGLRGFIIDLTEKKKLESQIRQHQKIEAIGTLAGGIAHDFNNILSAVLGYADLSLAEVRPGSLVHCHLLKIRRAGERARDMVRQILTFSRKTDQELVPVQIKPIVEEALKLIRIAMPATIVIDAHMASSATVLADPTQIHQVLMNLCTNAGQAMAATGGRLTVAVEDVADRSDDNSDSPGNGPWVRIAVADNGCGMTPEVQERIFDPFFTTKSTDKGTGLGLAVVHGIVQSHGGSISVVSSPGRGAAFTIHLPVVQDDFLQRPQEVLILPRGNEAVLWVDDEPVNVELGVQVLQRLGYTVEGTVQASEALDLFRAGPQRFDLVITDMTMPEMTGAALARQILALRPDIPIILCTGYSDQISEEKALSSGITAYALKPIEIQHLARLVRRILDGRAE